MPGSHIYGPLLSVSDLGATQHLFTSAYGMEAASARTVGPFDSGRLFGVPRATEVVVVGTPGVDAGAVLCRFGDDGSWGSVRDGSSRLLRDAFRVIDFYAPDFDAALGHVREAGYPMQAGEAAYETADGSFREAHHRGADQLVTALLHGPADFFTDFAEVRDRMVSEPVSISLPLSDARPTLDWYRRLFDWEVVYGYEFVDPSFSALMEVDDEITVRSCAVGPSRRQTYVNIVDYGVLHDPGSSLTGRSVPPRRGLLGLAVLTDGLDAIVERAEVGDTPVSAVVQCLLPPFGPVRLAVVTAPIGAPHLLIERV